MNFIIESKGELVVFWIKGEMYFCFMYFIFWEGIRGMFLYFLLRYCIEIFIYTYSIVKGTKSMGILDYISFNIIDIFNGVLY